LGQLEIQNSRLVNENRELLTRLEAAETYLEEMEQKMLFAQGAEVADVDGGAAENRKVASLKSENFRLAREVQELRIIVEATGGAPNVAMRELSGQEYVGSVTPRITSPSPIPGSLQMGQAIYQPAPQSFSYASQVGAMPSQAALSSATVPQAYQAPSSPYPEGGLAKGSLAYQMAASPYQATPAAGFRQPGTFTVPSSPYPKGTFTVPSLPSSSYQVAPASTGSSYPNGTFAVPSPSSSYQVAPASTGFPELQPAAPPRPACGFPELQPQPLQRGSYSRAQSPTGYAPQLLVTPQTSTVYAPQVSTPTRIASQPPFSFPTGTPLATMGTPSIATAPFAMPLSAIKTAAPQFAPNVADFPIVVETVAPAAAVYGGNNAARRGSATDMLFDMLDKNHDGVVSRQEFRAGLKGHIIAGGGTP